MMIKSESLSWYADGCAASLSCIRIRIMITKDDNLDLRKETSQKSRYSQGGITERPSAKEIGRG
jgi:hypothetical protein